MNADLYIPSYGPILLKSGWPSHSRIARLPMAREFFAEEEFGSIQLQEVQIHHLIFRFFSFYFHRELVVTSREHDGDVQSLIALKGSFTHGFHAEEQQLSEGQFTLLLTGHSETQTRITGGAECRIFNASYPREAYSEVAAHFPAFQKRMSKERLIPGFLLPFPRPARLSILDAIREIIYDHYHVQLQEVAWQLKLRQIFFAQLAQTYVEFSSGKPSALEKELAARARRLIGEDIKKHHAIEDLAKQLHCSPSTLKRAFQKEYGIGMYEYLLQLRLHKARELLLGGAQVKTACREVGMRPSNFSVEFKKFFGYTATSIRGKTE